MKELKIKHIWLVILYIWYLTFTSKKVILPKNIKEDEIIIAIGIIAFICLFMIIIFTSLMLLII